MFTKSLDEKPKYKYDGVEVVDLAESIFDPKKSMTQIYSTFKVIKDYEMRPDLVSKALYGTTDYTEMVLKYSMITNPFSIEYGDYVNSPSIDFVYNPIKEATPYSTGMFDAIKNYHKYIDPNKVPNKVGSDSVDIAIVKLPEEANISKKGDSGLTMKDGKIYFGSVDESVIATNSPIVDCATDGTSVGEFLNATIKNSNGQSGIQ